MEQGTHSSDQETTCPCCGQPKQPAAELCSDCQLQLKTPDPSKPIQRDPDRYDPHKPKFRTDKLIVVLGMWLLDGSWLVVLVVAFSLVSYALFATVVYEKPSFIVTLLCLGLLAGIVWFSAIPFFRLKRLTENYLRYARRNKPRHR